MPSGSRKLAPRALGAVVGLACLGLAMPADARFNDASLQGSYVGAFSGTITYVPTDPGEIGVADLAIPTWTVARFVANGRGQLRSVKVTYNIGGCVILELNGNGTYNTDRFGSTTATVNLSPASNQTPAIFCALPFDFSPGPVEFEFQSYLNQSAKNSNQTADGITTRFDVLDEDGQTSLTIAGGALGSIKRQGR